MPIDRNALLALWKLEDMPARDAGMRLAYSYLECCGEGVTRLGREESEDRMTEIGASYLALVEHIGECEDCNEV